MSVRLPWGHVAILAAGLSFLYLTILVLIAY
jgi:hypothetical protein